MEDLGFEATLINTFELKSTSEHGSRSDLSDADLTTSKVKTSTFIVKGMTCASCMGSIENRFKDVEGSISINISLLTNKAVIVHDACKLRPRQIIQEIEDIGFEAELEPEDSQSDIRDIVKAEMIKYRQKLILGFMLYLPIALLIWLIPYVEGTKGMMVAPKIWKGNTVYILAVFILSSIIQFYMGIHFYKSAYKSLKHKSANMDVLIVVSTTSAWIYGVVLVFYGYSEEEQNSKSYSMMIHNHVHNWETSAVLIFIVIVGKFIESFSKVKTVDKLSHLASLKVTKANLVEEKDVKKVNLSSKFKEIPVELLEISDLVMVQPGGAIPTDGVVVYGRGCCNESMLTGESRPVSKDIGVKVFGGSILTQGSIVMMVKKTSENATFN